MAAVLFLLILFLGISAYFLQLKIFSISNINIKNEKAFCVNGDKFENKLGILGKHILNVDFHKIFSDLKPRYPCIKDMIVSKSLPNIINIELIARQPFAKLVSIRNEATSSFSLVEATSSSNILDRGYIVDDTGIIFNKDESLSLVEIYLSGQKIELGKVITEPNMEDIKKILTTINNLGININRLITLADNGLFVDANPKIFFNLKLSVSYQLASLQLILKEAKIDDKEIEVIDLRFDKPIVKFAPKKNER